MARRSHIRKWLGLLLVSPLVLALSPRVSASLLLGIVTLVAVAVASIALDQRAESAWSWFSPGTTAAILYPLHFAVPMVTVLTSERPIFFLALPEQLASSMWAVAFGLLFHTIGYLTMRKVAGRSKRASVTEAPVATVLGPRLKVFAGLLIGLDLAGKALRIGMGAYFQVHLATPGDFPLAMWPVVMLMSNFGFSAFALCYAAHLLNPRPRSNWMVLTSFVWIYNVAFHLPTGRKESVLFMLVLPLLVRSLLGKPILASRRSILAVALAAAAVFGFNTIYRSGMSGLGSASTVEVSAGTIGEMFERGRKSRLSEDEGVGGMVAESATAFLTRLSLIESVYVTLEMTSPNERLDGQSFKWLLMAVGVPRALWPDKPVMQLGNEFGRRHGFISSNDVVTSISVTYIGEFIWNFGAIGVAFMLLLGAINASIFGLVAEKRTPERIAMYALVWLPIAYLGGEFATYYAGILRSLLVLAALWYLAGRLASGVGQRRGIRVVRAA